MPESRELPIWTVYDHPKDFPHCYVARLFIGETATDEMIISPDIERLRIILQAKGLVKLMRQENDDPVIMETWL